MLSLSRAANRARLALCGLHLSQSSIRCYNPPRNRQRKKPSYANPDKRAARVREWPFIRPQPTFPKIDGIDYLYGVEPCRLALAAAKRSFDELLVLESMNTSKRKDRIALRAVFELAKGRGLPARKCTRQELDALTGQRLHQGLVLLASPLELPNTTEMQAQKEFRCVLALDEVVDPMNFGALLRSAHFFNVDSVVVCAKNSAPCSPTVSKASAGALEVANLASTNNMMQFLANSRANGWHIVGAALGEGSTQLTALQIPPGRPVVLLLGNEGTGLRANCRRHCDVLVQVAGHVGEVGDEVGVDSLNVSVSGGILLHHFAHCGTI